MPAEGMVEKAASLSTKVFACFFPVSVLATCVQPRFVAGISVAVARKYHKSCLPRFSSVDAARGVHDF
jgi:hypothetical protein